MFSIKDLKNILFDGLVTKKFIDNIKPTGYFSIESRTGENFESIEDFYEEKNLILDGAFNILANLMVTGDTDKIMQGIAIGNQGIVDSVEYPPLPNDTTLRNEVFRKDFFDHHINNVTKTVSFKIVIETTEANGSGAQIINEAGIYSADGTMFARKVFREFPKSANNRLIITWGFKWA